MLIFTDILCIVHYFNMLKFANNIFLHFKFETL